MCIIDLPQLSCNSDCLSKLYMFKYSAIISNNCINHYIVLKPRGVALKLNKITQFINILLFIAYKKTIKYLCHCNG